MKTTNCWRLLAVGLLLGGLTAKAITPAEAEAAVKRDQATVTFLEHLCDDHGGRLTGSAANEAAMVDLERTLRGLGYTPTREHFDMPGWVRLKDEVHMLEPVQREMRVIGLGYVEPSEAVEGQVVDLGNGSEESFRRYIPEGAIGLFGPSASGRTDAVAERAVRHELGGLLYINRVGGGQLLARTGGFEGEALPLPVFSVTQEEGFWMRRLLARDRAVKVRLGTESYTEPIKTANLRLTIPGKSRETVIVGAHFDSWDQGQGAMDNGLGIAQLLALARVLKGQELERTVELIWFNGEEQGLWGSKHAVEYDLKGTPVVMFNLDMVGFPIGVNAMGDEDLVPVLESWNEDRGDKALEKGVANKTWMASDHTPYQVAGVRVVTFNAPIPPESVRYYHDFGDTYDKLTPELILDSAAMVASLVVELASAPDLPNRMRSVKETQALFRKAKLEDRLKGVGLWEFER